MSAHATLLAGDMLDVLDGLPENSVHCVVTSPPYWGLRQYDCPPRVWDGHAGCEHEWADGPLIHQGGPPGKKGRLSTESPKAEAARLAVKHRIAGALCSRCGAWRGQLGLEPDYRMYVSHLVQCFEAIRRVLRPDGTAWLVIGDCFATGAGLVGDHPGGGEQGARWAGSNGARGRSSEGVKNGRSVASSDGGVGRGIGPMTQPNRLPQPGLKPKDLAMIPSRVALALQDAGWWLRQRIIWDKPNPMPESVQDRPTLSHEEVLLLAKSERYFYDWLAIVEPSESGPSDVRKMEEAEDRYGGKTLDATDPLYKANNQSRIGQKRAVGTPGIRNARSVWRVATVPYAGAHFATYPPELVARCIKAGTSAGGCCQVCGKPAERVLGDRQRAQGNGAGNKRRRIAGIDAGDRTASHMGSSVPWQPLTVETAGWELDCGHEAPLVPAVVLDPFGGSGTTAATAVGIGRSSIYVDASGRYLEMARQRIGPLLCADARVG